jgi:hypothetical protein
VSTQGIVVNIGREKPGRVAGDAYLKTSPNLSATTVVRPERVNAICVGFFGISLRIVIVE